MNAKLLITYYYEQTQCLLYQFFLYAYLKNQTLKKFLSKKLILLIFKFLISKSCLKKYLLFKILSSKKILINSQFEDKAFVEDSIIVEIPPGCLSKDKIHKF